MYRFIFIITSHLLLFSAQAEQDSGSEAKNSATASAIGVNVFLQQALGRVDLAIASRRVNINHLKGEFGEHFASKSINLGEKWTNIRQSVGRQGIDLLQVKVSSNGSIVDLAVGEVKFGKSKLNKTSTGTQLSPEWNEPRLKAIANRYTRLIKSWGNGQIKLAKMKAGLKKVHLMELPMGNETSATFWRENSKSPWKLDASKDQIPQLRLQGKRMSQILRDSANGSRPYLKELTRIKIAGKNLIRTTDTSILQGKRIISDRLIHEKKVIPIKNNSSVRRALTLAWEGELFRTREFIRTQQHLTAHEIKSQARDLAKQSQTNDLRFNQRSLAMKTGIAKKGSRPARFPVFNQRSFAMKTGIATGSSAILATGFDLGFQLFTTGEVNIKQLLANATAGAGAGLTYQIGTFTTQELMGTQAGLHLSRQVATSLGLQSTSFSANLIGSAVGGAGATAVFSYILYFTGQYDLVTAHRSAFAGTVGFFVGSGFSSLIGGSAAISSALLATGVGFVFVATSATIMYGFHLYDDAQENKRLHLTYQYLKEYYSDRSH